MCVFHRIIARIGVAAAFLLVSGLAQSATAASVSAYSSLPDGTTSDAARRDALRLIPLEKLSKENRAKVDSVLSNISVFRRMPTRVVDCDPEMFTFLVRHPDVVVNIWEVFDISRLKLWETDDGQFRVVESAGASASVKFVYGNHDTHVIYGEGSYQGPLLNKTIKGRGVLVLKNAFVRETNGRYYVTCRMDSFLSIEPVGAEIVTKTVSPLVGKTVDSNFIQTLAFVGSLSRTAEVNSRGVQRLGSQLTHIEPAVRERFIELAAEMPKKYPASTLKREPSQKVALQSSERNQR